MRLFLSRGSRRTTTVAFAVRRVSVVGLALIGLSAPPAVALSVFDTIQLSKRGYSDQAIIDLIEATDSAFDLEAEDLPRLKQLGVSEPVIRSMLARAVSEGADSAETGAAAAPHQTEDVRRSEPSRTHSDVVGAPPHDIARRASAPRPDSLFTAYAVHEARSGHHLHLALALGGVDLFVLRDEGGYASMEARGEAIVERLREAWAAGRGRFRAQQAVSGGQVVFRAGADGKQQTIRMLTVSAGDARAYELRSGRSVTPDLLAAYWADLFSDFWAVAHGDPPEQLRGLHEGEALRVLHEALVSLDGPDDGTLRAAVELVPSSTRHHLQRLARTVPIEYNQGAH